MANEAFFDTLRKRFSQAAQSETELRKEMLTDLKFRAGDHWPEHIRRTRELDQRPCITINRLPASIHQVVNDVRQNKPSPKVSAVDDGADVQTAEVYKGLIRHIERRSHAPAVRSYAADYAITVGRGYYRIITEYADELSFDQEILIKRIKNPFSVYFDPAAQEPDYSDARWAFIISNLAMEDYREQFPESQLSSVAGFNSIGDRAPLWVTANGIQVAEYFEVSYKPEEIALLDNGEVIPAVDVVDQARVAQKRTTMRRAVKWYKTNGFEILEETEWPGRWIPIIPVLGEELDIDGETRLAGMVRDAREPSQMYNYWATAETEMIALAPRSPYVAAEGQIENRESEWANANIRNYAVLQYKPKAIGDHLVPPPQRQAFEPPVIAISHARAQAADDIKATTGIYDASLGARSNEVSGRAILARQREGDVANFHYSDGINTATTHEARIIVDLIPRIYDRPGRVARIIGDEGDERQVRLNEETTDKGIRRIYALGAGTYDVAIDVGPSFQTKRQEAAESMLEFVRVFPAAAPIIGDLLALNMDWPGAQDIADRLKTLLPPELQVDEGEGAPAIPPEVQAKLEQAGQMIEQLTARLNEMTSEMEGKKLELESKERIELMKIQAGLVKADMDAGSREAMALLSAEMRAIRERLGMLRIDEPVVEEEPEPTAAGPAPGSPAF